MRRNTRGALTPNLQVMPHNLFLHSALMQSRNFEKSKPGRVQAINYGVADVR